ncbi:MAG: hypothetical protein HYZ68_02655 [Chloroflexi bacterium]|nr:hypothetical protein [Chloroflexota bacterium]
MAWGQGHRLARELPRAQELQQRIEDREAGALIAQEAGCIVTDFRGGPCNSSTRRILAASSPSIHRALLELTRDAA